MSDADGISFIHGDRFQLAKLCINGLFIPDVVQENISAKGGNIQLTSGLKGHRTAGGEAVHEKKPAVFNGVNGCAHGFRMGCEFGSHVVVDPGNKRQAGDVLINDLSDLGGTVIQVKGTGSRIEILIERFHGLVEHAFMPFRMYPPGERIGSIQAGQDGEGEWDTDIEKTFHP